MVHLNKNLLTEKQLDALFSQFANIINPNKDEYTENILSEILGKEERIMIAKRLATIVLIIEGKSLYSISKILKISPSTADNIKFGISNGRYHSILHRLGKSKKNYFAILDTIDAILHLGGLLPHYGNGSEGWSMVSRLINK